MAEMRRKSDQDFREGCGPTGPGDRQADRVGGPGIWASTPRPPPRPGYSSAPSSSPSPASSPTASGSVRRAGASRLCPRYPRSESNRH
jgi:hypothetical protein